MTRLICRVRKIPVADSPEERVRQTLISHMIGPAGCPSSLLAVEVPLKSLVGPSSRPPPPRRIDIVCYSSTQDGLKPFLLVECKAAMPRTAALRQLNGYNHFLHAPVLALAWPDNIVMCFKGKTVYQGTVDQMPSYDELLHKFLFHNFDLAYSDRREV